MCEVLSGQELTLTVPKILLGNHSNKNAFSIDYGSSSVKIVYTSECVNNKEKLLLHFITFPDGQREQAFTYIRDKLGDILDKDVLYQTTGLGCNIHRDLIQDTLGVKIKNIFEMECFPQGFKFLMNNFPHDVLMHSPSAKALRDASHIRGQFTRMMQHVTAESDMTSDLKVQGEDKTKVTKEPTSQEAQNQDKNNESGSQATPKKDTSCQQVDGSGDQKIKYDFPVLVANSGSMGGVWKLNEDGSTHSLDGFAHCGKFFLGLGSLLTGAKSFEELVNLAITGTAKNVDIYGTQVETRTDIKDAYSSSNFKIDIPVFSFGHAINKDLSDFKKEDLAAALLDHLSEVQCVCYHNIARMEGVKQIYFCGGFPPNSEAVRDSLWKVFARRNMMYEVKPNFLKLGAHIGNLGALLNTLDAS